MDPYDSTKRHFKLAKNILYATLKKTMFLSRAKMLLGGQKKIK